MNLGVHAPSEHTVVALAMCLSVCSSYICSVGGNQVKVNVTLYTCNSTEPM